MMTIAKPFEEGLRQRKLLLPWCTSCGEVHFYPRSACPHCWGEQYEWRQAKGTGRIHSFTVTRANPPSAFVDRLPFGIAIIDLDEGVRMLANIVPLNETVKIDDRVEVTFIERDGQVLPAFQVIR